MVPARMASKTIVAEADEIKSNRRQCFRLDSKR